MALIGMRDIRLSFGGPTLLDGVGFYVEPGERVSLIGRNGSGKTTLMKLLAGELQPDEGEVIRSKGLCVARLEQEVPDAFSGPVLDVVAGGLGSVGKLISDYHKATLLAKESGEGYSPEMEESQEALTACQGWPDRQRVEEVIDQMSLDANVLFASLSGGMKRRVMLARALALNPQLLLLDEPTNHLDLESIQWLEQFFRSFGGTLIFITHDRMFLDRLATRILELDRGQLTDWPGDYATYRRLKEANLEAEEGQNSLFDKKLAQEEVWIRQGIKARRTRNEGRVRALERMRALRRTRRDQVGTVRMNLDVGERSGKLVIEANGVHHHYDGVPLITHFSTIIQRGDKVGVIGPNGSGKTTLLRLLLGELSPQKGTISLGTRLEVAYFDQLRSHLDDEKTVIESVGQGRSEVMVNGKSRHIISYLRDFLFSADRARSPVKVLSGGERNRLLLARLFLKSSNVLVMDEPTNDLDVETLELLEGLLVDYSGTLLLVSHDRVFLNNVVTSTLVFEGEGRVGEYVGGYDDWLDQRSELSSSKKRPPVANALKKPQRGKKKGLNFKQKQALESLPKRIEQLELEQSELHKILDDPDAYQKVEGGIGQLTLRLEALEKTLETTYELWDQLETLGKG